MTPVIALVGRPNVGKSTLFNVLTRARAALVADFPGLTRDRLYGRAQWLGQPLTVVDTGGIDDRTTHSNLAAQVAEHTFRAIDEADAILFLVDGRCGLTDSDIRIARQLQPLRRKKPILVVVNKTEDMDTTLVMADFYRLGLGDKLFPVATEHRQGITTLMQHVVALFDHPFPHSMTVDGTDNPTETTASSEAQSMAKLVTDKRVPASIKPTQRGTTAESPIKVAIIGRPNVGKSSLTNVLLGETRSIVYDLPGTTRDSVTIPLQCQGGYYALIDTAGVRRRAKISEKIETFSVIKTLQAIEEANVVLMVIDAQQGAGDQELSLLNFVLESGRALVVVINKWDTIDQQAKLQIKHNLERRLNFINFARRHFVSALKGIGVSGLFSSITEAHESAIRPISTGTLNRLLQQAQTEHLPPLVRGRRIKLKYAHLGGHNPPTIVIHGNQIEELPAGYRRYLMNYYRQALEIVGTPIFLQLKSGENPYARHHNVLTIAQQRKRQRMIQHHKRRERSLNRT